MASPSIDPWGYNNEGVSFNGRTAALHAANKGSIPLTSTKSYWYIYFEDYCPVCGRSDDYKYRVYDRPKPVNYNERHIFKESYDWCDG